MDSIYYRIDHKKKLLHFDNTSLAKMKGDLFYELSSKNESTIHDKILKIFNYQIKELYYKPRDKIFIIYDLIEIYKKKNNIQLENYDKISINLCKKLIEKDFKMTLNFDSENINDICILMTLGYIKIFSEKVLKYKTYQSFTNEIQEYRSLFIDFIRIYKSYNYSLPSIVPEIPRNTVPNEILLLMEIFQGIKKINLCLKDYNNKTIIPYLIILLNYDWLFPFVFDIEMDLSLEKLSGEIENLYYEKEKNIYIKNRKNIYDDNYDNNNNENDNDDDIQINNINLIKKDFKFYNKKNNNIKNIKFIKEKNINQTNNVNNPMSNNVIHIDNNQNIIIRDKIEDKYLNIVKKNMKIFDVTLCYYYLIREVKYLKTLSIKMPDGFIKENIDIIRMKNIPDIGSPNINIFEYLTIISSLFSFNIIFNCLEKKTFENILYMVQNNMNLKELTMNFFPNDNKVLNSQKLIRIAEECGLYKKILSSNKDNLILTITSNNEMIIKQKLLEIFEKNLEKLFLLLQTKKRLEKIELILNVPLILNDNEGYHWTILKFLLNIILLLQKEKFNLKDFKLILPYFNLDNRKYPVIGEFLQSINLNEKSKLLKNFQIQATIMKLYNIRNLISYNLLSLNIGEFDLDTFKAFIEFYHTEEYLEKSQLKSLCISLNRTVVKYKECMADLTSLISGRNPNNLFELTFKCYFHIKKKRLYELLISANGNKIEKYNIIMKADNLKKYKKIINHNEFYYLNKDIEMKINKYIPILKKYNLFDNNKKNIAKKLIRFLVPSNRKKIIIEDIN